jgi:hypothetical protein
VKKSVAITCTALATVAIIAIFFIFFYFFDRQVHPQATDAPPYAYIVKAYDGKIGVFEGTSDTPIQIIDMALSLLPPYDQAELEAGIFIRDETALRRLLEDFTS